jgi:hypothetical protein
MKRCRYCGQEYPDDVDVCAIDEQPLADPAKLPATTQDLPLPASCAFDARLVSHGVSSGLYRIRLRGSDLLFVQIEAGEITRNWHVIAALFGPFGGFAGLLFRLCSRRRANAVLSRTTDYDAEDLIHENPANLKLYIPEIRDAVLEPPATFALSGKQVGRLNLFVRDGKEIHLEFASTGEMKRALHLLCPALNTTLRINVEWNEKEQRFQRRKPEKSLG